MMRAAFLGIAVLLVAPAATSAEDLPPAIPQSDFEKLHALIKPRPGEFSWRDDLPWLLSLHEARVKAAAEGKPILIWNAADGSPLAPV